MKNLRIILNTDNRLEIFRSLFTWMSQNRFAYINGNYVVVDVNVNLTPKDSTQALFRAIQEMSRRTGYSLVLYEIKI